MKPLRIGIDARILQLERRGQGQYVYYLIKTLAKTDHGNAYSVFYNAGKRGEFAFKDLPANFSQKWVRVPGRILKPLWQHFDFPKVESFLGRQDIFHHTFNFNFTYFTPVPSKAKMVVTFNGMADPSTIWKSYDIRPINRWFEVIAQKAAKIIVVSESVRQDLLKRVKVADEKLEVIYYGVSDYFTPDIDSAFCEGVLERYGLNGKQYILYVGAADKNKNLSGLLRAFNLLRAKDGFSDIYLVMAGKIDELYRQLIAEAAQLDLRERVIFPGYIGHEQLPCIYHSASLFVLPTFHEWFGIPLIEAMACGTPVAAARSCGIPEVVGDAAVLFDPQDLQAMADCLTRLLTDAKLRENLREKGIQRAQEFTWQKTAEKTLAVYRKAA